MTRSSRARYAEALDALLRGRVPEALKERDWELLEEIARLAQDDAPPALAATDPALFQAWRDAVTRFHKRGWTHMTPERVATVRREAEGARISEKR